LVDWLLTQALEADYRVMLMREICDEIFPANVTFSSMQFCGERRILDQLEKDSILQNIHFLLHEPSRGI
jgi:hypothetical protein